MISVDLDALADKLVPLIVDRLPKPTAPSVRLLAAGDVAKMIGSPSRKALEMVFVRARKRGERHPLEAMAIMIDGVRRWREADVVAWIDAAAGRGA
jgi:hypothetical protein